MKKSCLLLLLSTRRSNKLPLTVSFSRYHYLSRRCLKSNKQQNRKLLDLSLSICFWEKAWKIIGKNPHISNFFEIHEHETISQDIFQRYSLLVYQNHLNSCQAVYWAKQLKTKLFLSCDLFKKRGSPDKIYPNSKTKGTKNSSYERGTKIE